MSLAQTFAHSASTTLHIQVRIISGITTAGILDLQFRQANTVPEKSGALYLQLDGVDNYIVSFDLRDDTIEGRTLRGYNKKYKRQDATEKQ